MVSQVEFLSKGCIFDYLLTLLKLVELVTIQIGSIDDAEHLELQDDSDHTSNGMGSKSSLSQATVNMVKMCIGTGVLAIPFAATEGGLMFHVLGTGLLFLWNYYSVKLLVQSEQYIDLKMKETDSFSVSTTDNQADQQSTFSEVAAKTFGLTGMHAVDCSMIFLMIGIVIAYEGEIV